MHSGDFSALIRLEELQLERGPLLAERVLGEVALLDQPRPERGFSEVELGRKAIFSYDIGAHFDPTSAGFDGVRINTGGQIRFLGLELGQPPLAIEPAAIEQGDQLTVRLPERIGPNNPQRVRLVFETEIFLFATIFQGAIFAEGQEDLPQPILDGDVAPEVSTNSLRVLAVQGRNPGLLNGLTFSSGAFTPNGDGINDHLEISYTLFGVPESVPVGLKVFSLAGRLLARLQAQEQGAGPQTLQWDGRDNTGQLLAPGLYLLEVAPRADTVGKAKFRPVSIIY